ncbi:universal stress protein [Pedobacter cryophilus]|uniref:Universal stress protein n=1 Tax=Pedobacter cryophilus TaxID=2571271 RepID=A0A4U1BYL0_9SPHI|nr:universal stress protein [Pedobacter cryophilus]TKB97669.1 universal stress protein [Pedobacter cryophilus]
MKTFNILIPTDFSAESEQAFQSAIVLAKNLDANIHLLHVIQANDAIIAENPDLSEAVDLVAFHKKEANAIQKFNALKEAGLDFEPHVKIGLLTKEINKTSRELNANLVIMGTKGSSGFMEKISGSEAQHVVRQLEVPVLTLRPGTSLNELKNILLVADYEHFGKGEQINMIKQIADAFDSTIHLLQILKEGDEPYADEILEQMKFFAKEHQLVKFETHFYRDKKIAEGVRNFNKEAEMDLVCIRTHGRKGISHLLFGSIAERLVNHCLKPLLTFHLK